MLTMSQEEFEREIVKNKKGYYYIYSGRAPHLPDLSSEIGYRYHGNPLNSTYLHELYHLNFKNDFIWVNMRDSPFERKLIKLMKNRQVTSENNVIVLYGVKKENTGALNDIGFTELRLK